MPMVWTLAFCHLFLAALATTWRLTLAALPLGDFTPPPDCPQELRAYLESAPADLEHCLPPRSDHAAPGMRTGDAPAAICLLLEEAGLPAALVLFPYRHHHQARAVACA